MLKVISRSTFDLQIGARHIDRSRPRSFARLIWASSFSRTETCCGWPPTLGSPAKLSATGSSTPCPLAGGARLGAPYWKAGQSIFRTCWPIPNTERRAHQELAGYRSTLSVPLLRDGTTIGVFGLGRREPNPFTDKQIELVTTFADQAVIAIENARLLSELRQRTDELGRSVEELRALGEVSQAVNSTLDLETVLSTIVAKAVQLSGTEAGAIYVFDDLQREFHLRATYGMDQELIDALTQQHIGIDETNVARALAQREPIQIADLREEPPYADQRDHPARRLSARGWWRRSCVGKRSSACWWSAAARPAPSPRIPST